MWPPHRLGRPREVLKVQPLSAPEHSKGDAIRVRQLEEGVLQTHLVPWQYFQTFAEG